MVASSLRGEIASFFMTESGGQVISLRQLCQHLGVRFADQEARTRVRNACGALRRDGEQGGPIKLKAVIKAQAWQMVNYTGPVPTDPTPAPTANDIAPEDLPAKDEDEPTGTHFCPYELIGTDSDGNKIVRDTGAVLYRLSPL